MINKELLLKVADDLDAGSFRMVVDTPAEDLGVPSGDIAWMLAGEGKAGMAERIRDYVRVWELANEPQDGKPWAQVKKELGLD